jgi:hypothetical protein
MEELKRGRTWLFLFLSGLIGWMLTHLLDKLSNGTIRVWDHLLAVLSLGSASVRDLPYVYAALNPYPLAPLMILYALTSTFVVGIVCTILAIWTLRLAQKWQERGKPEENRRSAIRRIAKYYIVISTPFLIICFAALFIQVGIANQAVLVRRIYEADRDILAPHVTPMQLAELQAQFCSMRGKSDFTRLMNQMESIAKEKNAELRPEKF